MRDVSNGLESYCPQLQMDLEDLAYADLGAVDIPFGAPEPVVQPCIAPPARCSTWGSDPDAGR